MSRAYIRLDPAFDEHKEAYPDGPYAALVASFCLAEQQPQRGRFRSLDYLKRLLGKRGRHVAYLVEHGDLTVLPDERVYVDGWDEWQEGDWKVGERVARIRNRPRRPNGHPDDDLGDEPGAGNATRNGPRNGPRNGGGNASPSDENRHRLDRQSVLGSAGADGSADKGGDAGADKAVTPRRARGNELTSIRDVMIANGLRPEIAGEHS